MKQLLLRLFSRKTIAKCDDFGSLSSSVLGVDPPPVPDVDKLLRGLSGSRENGTRETNFLEFKAHYLPKQGDNSTGDACKWNVVEAMVSMANAWGGCILLGVGEDKKKKELYLVDIGYKTFCEEDPKREDRDFCAYVQKELLGTKDEERLAFEVSDAQRYELGKEALDRLRTHVSFHLCHSVRLKGPVLAILVSHIGPMNELIPVSSVVIRERKKVLGYEIGILRETQKELLFHRDPRKPDTARKEWKDVGAYYSEREKNKPDFSKVATNLLFRIDGRRVHRWSRHFEEVGIILVLLLLIVVIIGPARTPEAENYWRCLIFAIVSGLVALSALGYYLRHRLAPLNSLRLDATVRLNGRELDVELWRIVTENKNVKSRWRYCYEVHLRWADSLEDAPFRVQQIFVYDDLDRGLRRGIGIETVDLNNDGYDDLAITWHGRKKDASGNSVYWAKAVFLYDPRTQDLDLSNPVCEVSDAVDAHYRTCSDIPKKEFMFGYFPVGNNMIPLAVTMRNARATEPGPAVN